MDVPDSDSAARRFPGRNTGEPVTPICPGQADVYVPCRSVILHTSGVRSCIENLSFHRTAWTFVTTR